MQNISSWLKRAGLKLRVVAVLGLSLSGLVFAADGPTVAVNAKVATQKVALKVVTGNPDTVSVHAHGPVLKADVTLQSQSDDCLDVVSDLYPGVCVPIGPGLPVSPN
jgi:hypothetical protein